MKQIIVSLALCFFLSACTSTPTWTPVPQPTKASEPTNTPLPIPYLTPTMIGTWRVTIVGTVYDASVGKSKTLPGARVTIARSSIAINSETQEAITDARGKYRIEMLMHDTDQVRISGQTPGYLLTLNQFTEVNFYPAGEHRVDLALVPIPTPTVTPR